MTIQIKTDEALRIDIWLHHLAELADAETLYRGIIEVESDYLNAQYYLIASSNTQCYFRQLNQGFYWGCTGH